MEELERQGPALHVVMRKEDLDPSRIADKTIIVVDILFATTSIIAALEHVPVVFPAMDEDEARQLARQPDLKNPVLAGESNFRFIDGFAVPTPLALGQSLKGRDALIYATTNGTVALRGCNGSRRVLVGSLINAGATAAVIAASDHRETVLILCAGSAGSFNQEDFYGAGCLVDRIMQLRNGYRLTDAAQTARDYFRSQDAGDCLKNSLVGHLMHQWEMDSEVGFAARIDSSKVSAEMSGGRITRLVG